VTSRLLLLLLLLPQAKINGRISSQLVIEINWQADIYDEVWHYFSYCHPLMG